MRIFTSYASEYGDLAERLSLAFEAEGHASFLDRARLRPGQPYNDELRDAIAVCDLFVFLVAPESVAAGSYARAELTLVEERWRRPAGRVLPVIVAPTPFESIPPYLAAVTILQPQGDVVAETVAAVARMQRRPHRWVAAAAIALIAVAAAGGGYSWQQHRAEQAQRLLDAQVARELAPPRELCAAGSFAAAWPRLQELAAQYPRRREVGEVRADCAMRWLREIRVQVGKESFSDIVKEVQPAIVAELSTATGSRAADLRAHLGWAEYLRSRDGAADADPVPQYRRALDIDPDNVYARAMWGHNLMLAGREQAALAHFSAALESGRERGFVRTMELASMTSRIGLAPNAVRVADEMRRGQEPLDPTMPGRLWSSAYSGLLFNASPETRARFLALLPPEDHLATFDWLFPDAAAVNSEPDAWKLCRAMLLANAGRTQEARTALQEIRTRREAARDSSYVLDEARRQLAALK
jgi:tetratricopeptide (TPR) repeat protein